MVVREPKLHRIISDPKYGKRTVWLKNSSGWACVENKIPWQSVSNPRQPIKEWVERGVFIFELSDNKQQITSHKLHHVAAALDDRVIDIPVCNVRTWHSMLLDKGFVRSDVGELSDVACSCCDMADAKWSVGELWDEDSVDTIEAVILDSRRVYSSLIGTLVIVMHEHTAELHLINQAHVRFGKYHGLPIIIFRSLYQELKREEDYSSVAICAPSVLAMDDSGCWSPFPLNGRTQQFPP